MNLSNLTVPVISREVANGFNKHYIGNLPKMEEFHVVEILSKYGYFSHEHRLLKSFQMMRSEARGS